MIRGEVLLVCISLTFCSMQAQLRGVFDAAVAGGITFFDTAEVRSSMGMDSASCEHSVVQMVCLLAILSACCPSHADHQALNRHFCRCMDTRA